jgi:hypothetical protein
LNGVSFPDEDNGTIIGDRGTIHRTPKRDVTFIGEKNKTTKSRKFILGQYYPNPFNSNTTINFSVPRLNNVTIQVNDVLGREIPTLVNEDKPHDNYTVEFNSIILSNGVYFYKLLSGQFSQVKK